MSDMPTSPLALLLYLALLIPGLVYVLVWERKAPHRRPSAFRESAAVVFVSVIAELAVLSLFALYAAVLPEAAPNVDRLIREGQRYAVPHWVSLTWWTLGLLALASAGAAAVAWWVARHPHASTQSAWWELFWSQPRQIQHGPARAARWARRRPRWIRARARREAPMVKVGCVMDDGTQWSGTMAWFNQLADEVPDRDLILLAPIFYQQGQEAVQELNSHAVCLSARHITAIRVRYELESLAEPPPAEPPPPAEEPSADEGADAGAGATICEEAGKGAAGAGQVTGTGLPPLT